MKIQASIHDAYEEQLILNRLIEEKVREILGGVGLPDTWHYEGRIKSLESFALKVETGLVDPLALEDFFACTLVVPTMALLDRAEAIVTEHFQTGKRKPLTDKLAMSKAVDFPFDHIRLYCQILVPPGREEGPLHRVVFEVQIKTFLQHAWSIATHDLTYKTGQVSWGTERVAAQVKATLEAAEVAIYEAERLAQSGNRFLAREDDATTNLIKVVDTLKRHFSGPSLPDDMKRLGQTVSRTLETCGVPLESLDTLLAKGRAARNGQHPLNLSPFGVVLQYLIDIHPVKVRRALWKKSGPRMLLPSEIALPASFTAQPLLSARLLV